jgi:cytochrome c biogenesis protein CcdA
MIVVGFADGVGRLGSFVVYGLGFGLPLVALSVVGATRGRALTNALARHHEVVLRASGVVLIVTALYELIASGLV